MIEDMSIFFNTIDFATPAIIMRRSGVESQIIGIFDSNYGVVNSDGVIISGDLSSFQAKTEEVTGVMGCVINIRAVNYNIVEERHDGSGISTLVLEKIK